MNLFRKHQQRTPAFTALLALLMAVAIAFCAIGFAAWSGARAQFKQVDAQYTTIAVPRGPPGLSNGSCIWVRFPICL